MKNGLGSETVERWGRFFFFINGWVESASQLSLICALHSDSNVGRLGNPIATSCHDQRTSCQNILFSLTMSSLLSGIQQKE